MSQHFADHLEVQTDGGNDPEDGAEPEDPHTAIDGVNGVSVRKGARIETQPPRHEKDDQVEQIEQILFVAYPTYELGGGGTCVVLRDLVHFIDNMTNHIRNEKYLPRTLVHCQRGRHDEICVQHQEQKTCEKVQDESQNGSVEIELMEFFRKV